MSTLTGIGHRVEAPAAVPYRFGLFSVVSFRPTTDPHWRQGVTWEQTACDPAQVAVLNCLEPDELVLTDSCEWGEADPFTVYAYSNRSAGSGGLDRLNAQAIERVLLGEQHAAEQQLWAAMTAGATPTVEAAPALELLAVAEAELAGSYRSQGVLHMNRYTATILGDHLHTEGALLVTRLGTPVVAGGGYYPSEATPTTTHTIIGTGPVFGYRSDIDTAPVTIDRAVNNVSVLAERDYVLGWDCGAIVVTDTDLSDGEPVE